MRQPLDQFADRLVRNDEVQEFIQGLIHEKGVKPTLIIRSAQSKHQCRVSRSLAEAHSGGTVIAEKEFPFGGLFSREAMAWFDSVANIHNLTRAVTDRTLATYHWSNEDGTVTLELR